MAKTSGFKWDVAPNQAFPQLVENYTKAIFVSGRRVAEQRAKDGEEWMKANAPWTDRTGRARAGLRAIVRESPGVLAEIVFMHDPDLDYTVWLEIANQGEYAIIAPAVDYWGAVFMRDIQRIVNLGLAAR